MLTNYLVKDRAIVRHNVISYERIIPISLNFFKFLSILRDLDGKDNTDKSIQRTLSRVAN